MPYVKWMLGAEDLTPEDDMPIGRNVLELTDVRQSNNYTCVAMSTLGVIEAVAQIIVKGEQWKGQEQQSYTPTLIEGDFAYDFVIRQNCSALSFSLFTMYFYYKKIKK